MREIHPSRRSFLQTTASAAAAAPWLGIGGPARKSPSDFDPSFGTATEAMAALKQRRISSHELTKHVFARIARHEPSIHAFITLLEEQALVQAASADETRARRGKELGLLHGLPILMKDVFMTAGVRTTAGSLQYKELVPTLDATVVARMKRAGAIVIGKTNMPELATDWQSFNAIAGRTNNPWDLTRTPGGSTGGGAAALATGMGFLETGSDVAGSIRTPAHFCGIYGHKPSLDLAPTFGHIPPPPAQLWSNPLLVVGPLARSADDLLLALRVIAGPEEKALSWTPMPPRKQRLRDYRIGYVLDDPFCAVDPQVREVLAEAVEALRDAGVQLVEGWPAGITLADSFDQYMFMAGGVQGNAVSSEQRAQFEELVRQGSTNDPYVLGVTASHYTYTLRDQQRLNQRARWQSYFGGVDAFLSPVHFIPAFPHDPRVPRSVRTLTTSDGSTRPYNENMKWISPATLCGLPATSAPVGFTKTGLPVGMQIIGPYYEDLTPIDIAHRLTELVGGFEKPPAYAD